MASELTPPIPAPGATEDVIVNDVAPVMRPARATQRWRGRLRSLTVADGVMALIGGLALWFRFGDLARLPLSPAEAVAALASRQFTSTAPLDVPVISPAYFTFTNLLMGLGMDGDAAARLVPAVFGLLTVLLLWTWRGRVRPVVWLTAALFMAVSPLLVAVSRAAGGDAIALFALMLLACGSVFSGSVVSRSVGQYSVSSRSVGRWSVVSGVALGLGLASSPLFYTGLVALLAAWLLAGRRSPTPIAPPNTDSLNTAPLNTDPLTTDPLTTDPLTTDLQNTDPLNTDPLKTAPLKTTLLATAVTFAAVATSFLLYPAGLGAALRLFPAWLAQFSLPDGVAGLLSPLLALLRYEPAALLIGLPALVWALGGERGGRGLAAWLGAALLVILAQSAVMVNTAAALLPAYLLVGLAAAALATKTPGERDGSRRTAWLAAASLLGLGALLVAAAGRFARLNLLAGENATLLTLALLAFVLAGVAVVIAMAWENPAARRGAFAGLAALLLIWQWGAAWQLSRQGANDPRERWVISGTDDDVPVMVNLLDGIAWQTANSNRDMTIFSQVDSPVLRWYLRDYANFSVGPALPLNTTADVIITPAGAEPSLPNDYFGADFGLLQSEMPGDEPVVPSNVLKWWLFRESAAPTDNQRVILWVRSDLARAD